MDRALRLHRRRRLRPARRAAVANGERRRRDARVRGRPGRSIVDGEVIEADPPRKLVQTWRMLMDPDDGGRGFTRLTHEIERSRTASRTLTLIHELEGAPTLAAMVAGGEEARAPAAARPGCSATSSRCSRRRASPHWPRDNHGVRSSAPSSSPCSGSSEPALVAELAAHAEARGWDGFFVWDHVAYRAAGPRARRSVDHAGGGRGRAPRG